MYFHPLFLCVKYGTECYFDTKYAATLELHNRRLKNRQNSLPLIRDVPVAKPSLDHKTLAATTEEAAAEDNATDGEKAAATGADEVLVTNGSADKDIRITENPLEHPAAV